MRGIALGTGYGYSDALFAARCIADQAVREGIHSTNILTRPTYDHIGAVLADSVLQAGLNYSHVVRPRVQNILEAFPHATCVHVLIEIIETEGSRRFLQWDHDEKVFRFENLVTFLAKEPVSNTAELTEALNDDAFQERLMEIRGIGSKTVDYMACLVGVDRIAVDRHIRGFAEVAGLVCDDYDYLKGVFSYAADLLDISRREFDAWVWQFQSSKSRPQLAFAF